MKTKIFKSGNSYAVRIPSQFSIKPGDANIDFKDNTFIIKPEQELDWPADYFDKLSVSPSNIERPEQGEIREINL